MASITSTIKSRNKKNEEKAQGNLKTQEILHSDFLESTIKKHINKEKYLMTLTARKAVSPDVRMARQRENFNLVEKSRKSFAILTLLRRKLKDKTNEAKQYNNMVMYTRDLHKAKEMLNKEQTVKDLLREQQMEDNGEEIKEDIS